MGRQDTAEPYLPCVYKKDAEIPFAPDGNYPFISSSVIKVKGISGRFQGLKCVQKTIIDPTETDEFLRGKKRRQLAQEAKILHLARHHHVVQLIHTYFMDSTEDQIHFSIVMDRADANLHDYLKPKNPPKERWFGCLVNAISHIHLLGIRHRDVKPSNILIKGDKPLLADFGISQMGLGKTMPTTYEHRNAARTREYCAPEVDRGSTRGRSADIFSLGAVFLEMLLAYSYPDGFQELQRVLESPSHNGASYAKHIDEVHAWIAKKVHLVGWQYEVLCLCKKMLHQDRLQRPDAANIELDISSLLTTGESMACRCAKSLALSENDKLVVACRERSEDAVKQALNEGANPNAPSAIHFAAAALQCASRSGSEPVVQFLLENGADVNIKDENEQTALHGASGQGHTRIVRMLLDSGADTEAEDLDGNIALDFAERRHHCGVVSLLDSFFERND
ncbi:kinase-like domain-containing protein [Ilyonectria robusta]|uniref:kinase-like domain-containing protein n=1 Tax=Ilyonectria robusta TaxID=1079257 RepID=UPI001E8DD5B7|nr:kinase-like domain-containing protein [Ilyonectria robusta]KAH8651742.1 kinase-like domain-containing protein [Ilyonectria robusta]